MPERPDLVRGAHVWALDTQVFGDIPHAGLLLEWAERDGVWHGLVVAVESFPQGAGWQVRQRWVAADKIKPVKGDEAYTDESGPDRSRPGLQPGP